MPVGLFSLKDAQEIKRLVLGKRRRFIRRERVRDPRGTGRRGGGACTNVLRIFVWTNADPDDITGTITIPFTYDSENGSATYNYNDTLATVESQFEGAVTTLTTDDVTATGVILTGALDLTFPDMSLLVCPRSGVEVTHTLADGNGTPIRVTAMVCCS